MNSIMQKDKCCYICGRTDNLQEHHIFEGIGRRINSEQEGLKVFLCVDHHTGCNGVHNNHDLDLWLKQKAEWVWLDVTKKSAMDFIIIFNKNYLDI